MKKTAVTSAAPGDLLIRNARLLDPASGLDQNGHVGIRDGLIAYIGPAVPAQPYRETFDAQGHWLLPGLVDLCARFREPGHTGKASFRSETAAAFAAGVTRFALPPDTQPVLDTPAMVARVQRIADAAGSPRLHPLGALTQQLGGEALAEFAALQAAGCTGLSNGLRPLGSRLIARRALEYARGLGLTVHVFAQDEQLCPGGCAHEGPVGTRLGLAPIPAAAEVAAIRFWISLVEDVGGRVHLGRLSTARGAELVETAQARGLPVSADVAAHQLVLTEDAIDGFNSQAHVIPPLRTAQDRDALRDALRKGVISAVCSDHQPHEADAKINPFPLTEPGISGLATLLPIVLQLVADGVLEPLQAVARLTTGPAAVLGVQAALQPGAEADLILLDPEARWTLTREALISRGKNSPFIGQTLRGRVLRTLLHGRTVHAA
ncbi:MAG: dihydroorotase [Gammaproteobacteria bacterium]